MKATIVTIYDHYNLGNRLQNYAVQKVLTNRGLNVETVQFMPSKITKKEHFKRFIQKLFMYKLPGDSNYWKLIVPREMLFEKFNKAYINTRVIKDVSNIKSEDSDFWVVGSDQVWNMDWYLNPEIENKMYFLTFAQKEQKICFAPSFGVDKIKEENRDFLSCNLKKFKAVSVREDAGAKIIKETSGVDAQVLIDPTMMLDAEQWSKIAKPVSGIDCTKPYILTYFLGEKTEEMQAEISDYARENNLKVYSLLDKSCPEAYVVGPAEFVYLISKSKLVLTDSFHACVFSFLFSKPFIVYKRVGKENDMSSRMDTFLRKFDLERKSRTSDLNNDLFEADYKRGFDILKEERIKVSDYLDNALS